VYSLTQRLRSLRHRFWFGLSERLRWSRGAFQETPALELPLLPLEQAQRIAALQTRYQVRFEANLSAATSVNNYEYLDILDRAWENCGVSRPEGGVVCDVGCASFWYAATLNAFFRPRRLTGIEVEGYRLFRGGHARVDYALGYIEREPNTHFVIADYLDHTEPADVITAWFPFLTPSSILAWRLPLSLLRPAGMMRGVYRNLAPGGLFIMINHGFEEAALGSELCDAAGFERVWKAAQPSTLNRERGKPPIVSGWRHRAAPRL
jgi:hypothetical protein